LGDRRGQKGGLADLLGAHRLFSVRLDDRLRPVDEIDIILRRGDQRLVTADVEVGAGVRAAISRTTSSTNLKVISLPMHSELKPTSVPV